MSNVIDDLARAHAAAERELAAAEAVVGGAHTNADQARAAFMALDESGNVVDLDQFTKSKLAVEHCDHLLKRAESLRDTVAARLAAARSALERARRDERIASLVEDGSLERYREATQSDARALVKALADARAAAERLDLAWAKVASARNALQAEKEAHPEGDINDPYGRLAPVVLALLESNPRSIVRHGPSSRKPGVAVDGSPWDPMVSSISFSLRKHGLSGALDIELFRVEPDSTTGEGAERQRTRCTTTAPRKPPPAEPERTFCGGRS